MTESLDSMKDFRCEMDGCKNNAQSQCLINCNKNLCDEPIIVVNLDTDQNEPSKELERICCKYKIGDIDYKDNEVKSSK